MSRYTRQALINRPPFLAVIPPVSSMSRVVKRKEFIFQIHYNSDQDCSLVVVCLFVWVSLLRDKAIEEPEDKLLSCDHSFSTSVRKSLPRLRQTRRPTEKTFPFKSPMSTLAHALHIIHEGTKNLQIELVFQDLSSAFNPSVWFIFTFIVGLHEKFFFQQTYLNHAVHC